MTEQSVIKIKPRLLSAKEVGKRIGLSVSSIERMIRTEDNSFPRPVRVGIRKLWRVEEVEAWIDGLGRQGNGTDS